MSTKTYTAAMVVAVSMLGLGGHGAMAAPLPLLDQKTVRAPFMAACEGRADGTPLPVDPRTLVVPGVNTNGSAAIQFNSYWVDLHEPGPEFLQDQLPPRPTTCGEFRAAVQRGRNNLLNKGYFQPFISAANYNRLYQIWGYPLRPSDFDEQVIKRYGLSKAPWRNPYPYPWENPNTSNGGSGQLPLGLIQEKDASGNWTGQISNSCSSCHDSKIGTDSESTFVWGRSNDANDAGVNQSDFFRASLITTPLLLAPLPWSTGRGATDAIGIIDLLPAIWDMDTMDIAPSLLEFFPGHAAGMAKAPHWYHRAWKPRQFWDGALTSDNVRSEMAFSVANLTRTGAERRAIYPEFEDVNVFLMSMSPPKYPKAINTALAEQGAVLFHERDLWAGGANADIPKAPGNGSCASCHGVYSPRHAANPNYLPDPRLKGVAGVITPTETIRTDPNRRYLMEDERKRRAWNTSWLAYNELSPDHQGFDDGNLITSELRRVPRSEYDNGTGPVSSPVGPNQWIDPFGYVAPPMYGVWAGAPYFHNGSVPDLWSVLQPAARPALWKRTYTPAGIYGKNKGYDSSFASFDFAKLGWKHTDVACSNNVFTSPFLPCSQDMATIDVLFANIANTVAQFNSLAYQSPPPITDKQIESRMVFNSHLYGNSKDGHDFTQSLTDSERWAIIEYLKTL